MQQRSCELGVPVGWQLIGVEERFRGSRMKAGAWEALEVFLDTAIRVPDSPYRDPIAGIIRLPSLCQVREE
jgi:hypothetical protein